MADQPFLASNSFNGDGSTVVWEFSFEGLATGAPLTAKPYIDSGDVRAELITGEGEAQVITPQAFLFETDNSIRVEPAVPVGTILRVYRQTENRFPLVNYQDLQSVGASDLDLANRQAVYIVQEARDAARGAGNVSAETLALSLGAAQAAGVAAAEAAASALAAEAAAEAAGGADVLRQDLANDTDPAKGAGQVGYDQSLAYSAGTVGDILKTGAVGFDRSPLASAITTVGGMLSAQWVNIWEYAALAVQVNPADVSTWDWQPAIQAAVDAAPGVLYFPDIAGGVYYTETAVIVDDPVTIVGDHAKRGSTAGGVRIDNRGTGATIVYSNTAEIYDAGIHGIALTATTGGAPLHIKYGAVRCHFKNLILYSKATNRPCVSVDYTVGTAGIDFAGMYSCVFEGGEYVVDNVARTAGIVDMFANGTLINENHFRNIWLTQSNGRPAIRLACTVNGPLLTNNSFTGLTFEVCSGGCITVQATSHTKISGVSAWDTPAGYSTSLITVATDLAVTQNRGLLIENFARVGNDPLVGAAVDIHLGNSRDTTIINHSPNAGAGAIIDANNRTAVIIGTPGATVNNGGSVTYLSGAVLSVVAATVRGAFAHTGTTAGFFGATPVAQQTAVADTSGATLGALEAQVNLLKQKLRNLGLIAT